MDKERQGQALPDILARHGGAAARQHVFLCTGDSCCSSEVGEAAWKALKDHLRALYPDLTQAEIYRTRVKCLRICTQGPIAVCYPEGRWFQGVTAEQVPGLVAHIASGSPQAHPLEFYRHPLPAPKT